MAIAEKFITIEKLLKRNRLRVLSECVAGSHRERMATCKEASKQHTGGSRDKTLPKRRHGHASSSRKTNVPIARKWDTRQTST